MSAVVVLSRPSFGGLQFIFFISFIIMSKYSQLAPLSAEEKVHISGLLMEFFNLSNSTKHRQLYKLKVEAGKILPLSFVYFLKWCKDHKNIDLWPKQQRIIELLNLLCLKNLFCFVGFELQGSASMSKCYWYNAELTSLEKKGILFLGRYVGPDIVAHYVKYNLAYITGKTKENGDESVGTGILLNGNMVLTCAHVINDMDINAELEINKINYKIPIGGWIGQNPITGGTIPQKSSLANERYRALAGEKNTSHNCYMSVSEECAPFWHNQIRYLQPINKYDVKIQDNKK